MPITQTEIDKFAAQLANRIPIPEEYVHEVIGHLNESDFLAVLDRVGEIYDAKGKTMH